MRISKFTHSMMIIDINEPSAARCIIDPGKFQEELPEIDGATVIIITHEHDDHWTPEHLRAIAAANPGVPVLSTAATAQQIAQAGIADLGEVTVASPGERYTFGAVTIDTFGGRHAIIHDSIPQIDNIGVVINDRFGYGGDAYALPPIELDLLAVPANAPWMRVAESMDFITAARPRRVFAVHDALLAPPGKELADARLTDAATSIDSEFVALGTGDHITL